MNEILIKWGAPKLTDGVSAIVGAVFIGSKVHKFILPANEVVKTGIKGPFEAKDFIVIQGTLPSGEIIQRTIDPTKIDQADVVTIGNKTDRDEPLLSLDSLLGNFKKSLPDLRELNLPEQIVGYTLRQLEDEEARERREVSRANSFIHSLIDSVSWENRWLRLWTCEPEQQEAWRSHPLKVLSARFQSGAVVCEIVGTHIDQPCFLELGRDGGVSCFMAVPPAEFLNVVIRAVWNPNLQDVTAGRSLAITSTREDLLYTRLQIAAKYLQENALSEAEAMVVSTYPLIEQSKADALTSVLAGYLMLKFGKGDRISEMAQTLHSRYPWLPDAAIISAWQLMQGQGSGLDPEDRRQRINQLLLEAVRSGMPLFTMGLRFLFDRLRQLQREAPERHDRFDHELWELANRLGTCDETQYLTTFFGMAPWRPTYTFDEKFHVPSDHRTSLARLGINWAFESLPALSTYDSILRSSQETGEAAGI
jgi:hypothetical protein